MFNFTPIPNLHLLTKGVWVGSSEGQSTNSGLFHVQVVKLRNSFCLLCVFWPSGIYATLFKIDGSKITTNNSARQWPIYSLGLIRFCTDCMKAARQGFSKEELNPCPVHNSAYLGGFWVLQKASGLIYIVVIWGQKLPFLEGVHLHSCGLSQTKIPVSPL